MPKQKHFYYVAVDTGTGVRLVTHINNASRYARWSRDEKPLAMTATVANDLAEGLCLNFHPAYVVRSFYEIPEQWVTAEPEGGDAE